MSQMCGAHVSYERGAKGKLTHPDFVPQRPLADTVPCFHTLQKLTPALFFFSWYLSLQIDAHEDDVNAVAFADSSSQLLFSGSDDALCKVWDRRTLREDRPQPVGHLAGHRDGITFIHSKVGGGEALTNSLCK